MSLLGPKLMVARAVGATARRSGRGGGTSLPGKVLLKLEPDAIGKLAARLPDGAVAISATNGKTTTAAMVATIFEADGRRLVHNRSGANMAGGIATALLDDADLSGRPNGSLGLFEVDEFWLPGVVSSLRPRAVLLGNLFRDQLDRYGELETIAERWSSMVAELPAECQLVLNADDPVIAELGRGREHVTYFGIEDPTVAVDTMQHAADSTNCRNCGAPYVYERSFVGHLGHYHCASCGSRRPQPTVSATSIKLHGTDRASFTLCSPAGEVPVELQLPGLYNVYNAIAAAALTLSFEIEPAAIATSLGNAQAAFGRAETITLGESQLRLLLVKNPAGANEVIRTLALEPGSLTLLGILNDQIADGRDVSWIWDADFELLVDAIGRMVCSGSRGAELALRLKYAGVDESRLIVIPELPAALDRALELAPDRRVHVLPTYTAMLALRDEVARRGAVANYWEQKR